MEQETLQALTANIAAAFVSHNTITPGDVAGLISTIGSALATASAPPPVEPEFEPAVNPARSIRGDKIISLIDGKPYSMLKRHLKNHGLTPDAYRRRYGLRPDYPMTAPDYSERRRQLAKDIGLGHMPTPRNAGKRRAG